MAFLDRIAACNGYDLNHFLPFKIGEETLGWMRPNFAQHLANYPAVFLVSEDEVSLAPDLQTKAARTQAVEEVVQGLITQGIVQQNYRELYNVTHNFFHPGRMLLERGASGYFGIRAFGVHINGIVQKDDGPWLWVAKRAQDKPTFPGMLDQIVAGGQPAGISLLENVIKESQEEADIPAELAAKAQFAGEISYCVEIPKGLKPDTMFIFDLYLPEDFTPKNTDGEVESFELLPAKEVMAIVETSESFKPNCNLVVIDYLLRNGLITEKHPEFAGLNIGLKRHLP